MAEKVSFSHSKDHRMDFSAATATMELLPVVCFQLTDVYIKSFDEE